MLIADSGSTKTDWAWVDPQGGILEIHTQGINPVRDDQDAILHVLQQELLPQLPNGCAVDDIHFFGAGCVAPFSQSVNDALQQLFPHSHVHTDSDLMGAALALCGDQPGVACILGTGSNSCYYDGQRIVHNVSPLGFILGDEGSGAVLGRTLLGHLFKGSLPQQMREEFLQRYNLTLPDIIGRVYRQPQPNRFLASLVPFIADHRTEPQIHQLLVEAFRLFFQRNVRHYQVPHMPVHFVGSIAHVFAQELSEAAQMEGFQVGRIVQRPLPEIAIFYQKRQKFA